MIFLAFFSALAAALAYWEAGAPEALAPREHLSIRKSAALVDKARRGKRIIRNRRLN